MPSMEDLLWSTGTQVFLEFAIPLVLAWWYRKKYRAPWPVLVVYALAAFASVVVLADRYWVPPVGVRVHRWAESAGYLVGSASQPGTDFAFIVRYDDGGELRVWRPAGMLVNISMPAGVSVPEPYRALSQSQRNEIANLIRVELLRAGVSYRTVNEENALFELTDGIDISRTTTSEDFLRRLFLMRTAAKLVQAVSTQAMSSYGSISAIQR